MRCICWRAEIGSEMDMVSASQLPTEWHDLSSASRPVTWNSPVC